MTLRACRKLPLAAVRPSPASSVLPPLRGRGTRRPPLTHAGHRRGRPPLAALVLLAPLALLGCRLVDQRTFDAAAGRPPVPPKPPVVAAVAPVPPLLTIRYDVPSPDYANALRVVVREALARKPDVLFEVVTLVPATGTPAQQVAAAEAANPSGRDVAQAILGDGADVGQLELAARADPAVTVREVRVYVH